MHKQLIAILLFEFYCGTTSSAQKYRKEDYEFVVKYSSKELSDDSIKNSEYFKSRGEAYYALGDFNNALLDFNTYLKINPKDSYTYYNRGVVKNTLGKANDAVEDFSSAIKLSTDNPANSYFARGDAYHALEDYPMAISDYKNALKHNPKHENALNNLGLVFIEKKDFRTAITYLNKALQLNADRVSCLFNRAYALIELEHYNEALTDLQNALKISPNNPYANNYMGYYLYRQNKKTEACKYFKIATSNGAHPMSNDLKNCDCE